MFCARFFDIPRQGGLYSSTINSTPESNLKIVPLGSFEKLLAPLTQKFAPISPALRGTLKFIFSIFKFLLIIDFGLYFKNDFLDIFQLSIKCLLSNDLDVNKINLSNSLSKLTNDEFSNYLSMLKFILIVANKLKISGKDKNLINMPNYLELESLSTNLTKKNLIDRFDYLTNNQKDLFSLNLDKQIFILNFLTQ